MNDQEEHYVPLWTQKVRKLGRVFMYNQVLWLSYSGTGIEWECEGGFSVRIKADSIPFDDPGSEPHFARFALYMDGSLIRDERVNEPELELAVEDDEKHIYRLIKLSESADSSMGIVSLTDEKGGIDRITPSEGNKLKIEIIGDSITCGYGVEGDLSQTYTTATEDVTKAYSYITAKKLNADYSIVSKSGAGIVSGYTEDGTRNLQNILTDYYDKMGCSMFKIGDVFPAEFEYDFSFEPDIIIINLGTNDLSYCTPAEPSVRERFDSKELENRRREFCSAYKSFLEHLREKNPFAKIICILGIMGEDLNNTVEMAVNMQIAEGDRRIWWLPLSDQDPACGYGTDYHPSVRTQQLLCNTVSDFVEKVLRKEV